MSEGFSVHFPARVGDVMYLLTQGGEIREGVVEGYTVDGCSPYKVCVRLSVEGKTMYRRGKGYICRDCKMKEEKHGRLD